jgi:hypothetical protein
VLLNGTSAGRHLLATRPGSSIHDHGRSNCLYLVTAGTMREEQFELNETRRPRLRAGGSSAAPS